MENTTEHGTFKNASLDQPSAPSDVYDFIANVFFIKIYAFILVIVGVIGNGLAIVILSKKTNRSSSTANVLIALAVSDICILFVGSFSNWLNGVSDINFRKQSGYSCILHIYFSYVPISVSSWLLALVTAERVISVVWPYKVKEWCTVIRTRIAIGATVICVCAFYLHFFIGFESGYNPNIDINCKPTNGDYLYFLSFVMPYLDFSVTFLLPCLIIIPGNIVIVQQLVRQRARRKALTSYTEARDSSITRTLVIAGVIFVLTVAPISILLITFEYWLETVQNTWMITNFWRVVLNALADTNAAVNFFLYVISGTKFREEVKELFCGHCGRMEAMVQNATAENGTRRPRGQATGKVYTVSATSANQSN